MHQVKAHDLQAFAASKVFQVSLEQILSACHWKFYNTFMQFNLKDVAWPDSDLYHLGPIVAAQQTRTTGCVIGPIFIYLRYSRTPYSTEPLRLAPIELEVLSVNFVKIALSCTVYKMCFCVLHRNSRWLPKMAENNFYQNVPVDSTDALWVKNLVKILHRFRYKCVFAFYTEIQDGHQK